MVTMAEGEECKITLKSKSNMVNRICLISIYLPVSDTIILRINNMAAGGGGIYCFQLAKVENDLVDFK